MTEQEQQALAQKILDRSSSPDYFSGKVGNRYESLSVRGGVGYVTATRENCNPLGILHGGVYYTLMDQLAGMAAGCTGRTAVTVDASINYLRSARLGETVRCELDAVHIGRSIVLYEGRCFGEDGRLQATGQFHLFFTQAQTDRLLSPAEKPQESDNC